MKHAILACWLLCLLTVTKAGAQTCTLTLSKSYDYLSTGQTSDLSYTGCTGGTVSWDHGLGTGNHKIVSPTATTTYSATCTPTSGAPCAQSITVNFIDCSVSASASPSVISSGQSSVLSYTGCVGGSVDWVDSRDNGVGSGNNLTISPAASITYIAQCNKDNGYCLSYVTVTVSNCSITASASTTSINAGQSSVLSFTGCTGGTVTWDNGVGTGNNKTVNPSATTTYTGTCTPAGGGRSCSSSVRVVVTSCSVLALASSTTINAGQSTELVYENCTNGTVSWDHSAGNGNNLIVSPSITTTYLATCTPTGGGTPCTNSVTVTVIPCNLNVSASPASITTGQNSVLTYTGCTNGTISWNNGLGTGNNKTVSPTSTTTYSATCTPSGGANTCTSSVTITVGTPCSVSASASPASINAGQSSVLSYAGCTGGTVSWDNGLGTGNNKTVSPSVTTTYVATCSPAGGGSSCSSSVTVTVSACSVLALASSTTINAGQITTLAYENCTNGTVTWNQGAGTGNNIVVSPSATTTYQATCNPTGGGTPCTSSVVVTVNTCSLNTTANSTTINSGQSSVLTYTGCSNGTVSWDNGLGSGNNKTVTPSATTTYSATCTPSGGGSVCTSSVQVTVTSTPCSLSTSASPTTINSGQSSVLSYTGCSGGTVTWDNGLGSGNNKSVSPTITTTYSATCTPSGRGASCTSSVVVTVNACNLITSASPVSINAGQSSVLSYTGCTGGTVSWDNALGSGNNKTVNPSITTTYSATCSPTGGGTPCTSSITVTVNTCNLGLSASPASINTGQSSVLSYTGCTGGTVSWNNGLGTGNNKTVSPAITTTYSATCSPAGGGTPCNSSVTVTVNTCTLTTSASPASINAGQSSVLSYTGCTGGTVGWNNGLGTGNNKTVSPAITTTYSATCSPAGGGTPCNSSVTVTVNTCTLTTSASPASINAGLSTVLSYSGCTGGTVSWDNGLGTGNNKTVNPSTTTTYQATCSLSGGGNSCSSSLTVTVHECLLTTSASSATVNAGQSTILSYTGCTNGLVSWDNGVGMGNNKTVLPSVTTTYLAVCTPSGGGSTCTNLITITVIPCTFSASASPVNINAGQNSVLSYAGCTNGTVSWDNGLGLGNNKTVTPSATTTYQATCTPAGGGIACNSSVTINVSTCNFIVGASPSTINVGQSSIVSFSGCTNGTVSWDNGLGSGNNITITPSSTTTYLATCTPSGGGTPCSSAVTVTVIPCNLRTSASPNNINAGQSSVLTYSGCSNGTVSWDNGVGTGNNKTVSPANTTTYTATCTPTGGGSACTSTVTVTVSTCNFTIGASAIAINDGQSSVLSYTGCANGTVSWDNGLGTGNNKTVSPSTTTTYQATCTPTGGGNPCTNSITVTVNACNLSVLASPTSINVGQSSLLTYAGCSNGTVSWDNGLGVGNNKTVSPTNTTTYQATCTPTGGGNPCTSAVTVIVTALPCSLTVSASPSTINAGQSSVLTYTGCTYGTVSWDNGLGTGNNKTVSPSANTTYQATCTPTGGGTSCSSTVTIFVNGCSLTTSASPSTINAGQSSVLTYTGCENGTVSWDNGLGTGTNKLVSPSVTTTYIATCMPSGGGIPCTRSVTITVDGCNLSTSANLSTVNAGQNSILTYTGCSNGTVSWDNGLGSGNNQTISPTATTTYKATCTPTGGGTPCTSLVTVTVNRCNLSVSTNLTSLNAGQPAQLTYTGCENGTVSWDNGLGTGNNKTVNPSTNTTYNATCTPTGGGNACTSSITISVNPCSIGSTASPSTINAGQNSVLTYTGCSNGTVSWDNGLGGGNAKTVNPTVTTTYIATCMPTGGGTPCTSPVTVNVIQCSISSSASPSKINVGQSAALTYTGCENGTVNWDNGLGSGNTKTVTPTATTTYRATCTPTGGGNNCSAEITLTVTPAPIAISSSFVRKPTCVNAKNGSLTINLDRQLVRGESTMRLTLSRNNAVVSTYFFDGPSFTSPETLEAGTYSVLIETLIGSSPSAQTTGSITIANPDPVTFSLTKTDVNCFGGSDGKIEILAAGGTSTYVYQLASASLTGFANGNRHSLTDLLPGTYAIQVFDSFTCPSTNQSIIVGQPASAVALTKVSQKDPRGFETKDGQAVVQVNGGTPGYTFEWLDDTGSPYGAGMTTGVTNKNSTLRGGTYRVRVYDAKYAVATQKGGCSSVVSFSLTEPPIIEAKIDLTAAITCFGKKDGLLSVTPTGGVPFTRGTAYTLSLQSQSNPLVTFSAIRNSFSSLPAGQYTLTVTDSNEVSRSFAYTLTEPQKIVTQVVSIKDLVCNGDKNGSVEIAVSGGNGGYVASWSNSAKGLKISNLLAGMYTGVVADAKGCRSEVLSAQVKEPTKLDATFTVKSPTCYSTCDGLIDAGISGGSTPYSFAWDGRTEKTTRLEKLCGGESLSFKVVDANGCQLTKATQIAQPVKLDIKLEAERRVCQGQTVLLDVTNSLAQSYQWTLPNGQTATTPTLEAKLPGIYSVSVFDQARCEFKSAVTVRQVQPAGKIRFAATSTAPVNEPIVILNLSDPAPLSIDWMTPAGATIILKTTDKLQFSMARLGEYTVGIKALFGECELYQTKLISIVDFFPKTVEIFPGQQEPKFLVSPNPVVNDFNVNLWFEKPTNFTIRLYNSANPNKVIFETRETELTQYTTQINALGLGAGTYILAVETATDRFVKRIVVAH